MGMAFYLQKLWRMGNGDSGMGNERLSRGMGIEVWEMGNGDWEWDLGNGECGLRNTT